MEETLNALLDAEADRLCGARKYERSESRKDTRVASYDRHLHTEAGEVMLTVPKLRSLPSRQRLSNAIAGDVSVRSELRRVEDITQALWGTKVSASPASELNQKIYGKIDEWR